MTNPKRERWFEQREMVRDAMTKALAENDMAKYDRLNNKFQKLNGKIRKERK